MPSTTPQNGADLSSAGSPAAPASAHPESVRKEFRALTSTSGVFDLGSRVKISLGGRDRVRWLNGMVTNNIRDLAAGQGVYAFLLNPQGRILGDLYAYNRGETLVVDTDRQQLEKMLATFDHYIIMDEVEVASLSDKWIAVGLAGPNAEAALKSAGFQIPDLKPLQIADLAWHEIIASIVRGEREPYLSYELWIAPEHAGRVRESLEAVGAVPIGRDALELYRIALGVPRYGQDLRERDLPQETEQQRALNFNKGCYVGQEIVERIRSRGNVHRKFAGFEVKGLAPAPGTKIQMQAKDVGEITSSAVIPALDGDHSVALGYIRREVGVAGNKIEIYGAQATVTDLPFARLLNP